MSVDYMLRWLYAALIIYCVDCSVAESEPQGATSFLWRDPESHVSLAQAPMDLVLILIFNIEKMLLEKTLTKTFTLTIVCSKVLACFEVSSELFGAGDRTGAAWKKNFHPETEPHPVVTTQHSIWLCSDVYFSNFFVKIIENATFSEASCICNQKCRDFRLLLLIPLLSQHKEKTCILYLHIYQVWMHWWGNTSLIC
jgi:hypothetical protein